MGLVAIRCLQKVAWMMRDIRRYVAGKTAKLKELARRKCDKGDIETSLEAAAACAQIEYHWNQTYYDDALECLMADVAESFEGVPYEPDNNTVAFYDGPGFDLRGLGLVYLKGLADAGFKVVCLTPEWARDRQPVQAEELKGCRIIKEYFDDQAPYSAQITSLKSILASYRPFAVIAQSFPFDPVWPVLFRKLEGTAERYVINMTDHAFWMGKDSLDHLIEFRNYGASVSQQYRKIDQDRQIMLPYYPYINQKTEYQGLPFKEGCRFIMSGGNLYKTFSDDNTYYNMVECLLKEFDELYFLYLGVGDTSGIERLQGLFPGRVFIEKERADFSHVIQRCSFYLNTYPIIGGLMTQYAAALGKVPLTINHGGRAEGLLLGPLDGVLFPDAEALLAEARRLLSDEAHLKAQNLAIRDAVITPERFSKELAEALRTHRTSYDIEYSSVDCEEIHREHVYTFDPFVVIKTITLRKHKRLWPYFPGTTAQRVIGKMGSRMKAVLKRF